MQRHRNFLGVTTGHSRSKNGIASLAFDPVVHAEGQQTPTRTRIAAQPHGLPGQKGVHTRLRRAMPGNDEAPAAIGFRIVNR